MSFHKSLGYMVPQKLSASLQFGWDADRMQEMKSNSDMKVNTMSQERYLRAVCQNEKTEWFNFL